MARMPTEHVAFVMEWERKVTSTHGAFLYSELKVTSSHDVANDSMPQEAFFVDSERKVTSALGAPMDSLLKTTSSHGVVNDTMPQDAIVRGWS